MLTGEWREVVRTMARSCFQLRTALGWSQENLATRAVVSQGAISRLESGRMLNVPLRTVVAVMQALVEGARQLDLPFNPPALALQVFLASFDGTITKPLDETFMAMLKIYHSIPPSHRAPLVAFLKLATTFQMPAQEVA